MDVVYASHELSSLLSTRMGQSIGRDFGGYQPIEALILTNFIKNITDGTEFKIELLWRHQPVSTKREKELLSLVQKELCDSEARIVWRDLDLGRGSIYSADHVRDKGRNVYIQCSFGMDYGNGNDVLIFIRLEE